MRMIVLEYQIRLSIVKKIRYHQTTWHFSKGSANIKPKWLTRVFSQGPPVLAALSYALRLHGELQPMVRTWC